jgi:hypothetical protein
MTFFFTKFSQFFQISNMSDEEETVIYPNENDPLIEPMKALCIA